MQRLGKVEFMRKSSKQAGNSVFPEVATRRVKEGLFIALCTIALFLLLALITYNTDDPGWSRATTVIKINNSAGSFGAWLADVLLAFFGYVAYLVPVLIATAGVLLFRESALKNRPRILWLLHIIGFALIITSGCALVALLSKTNSIDSLPGPTGGIIGSLLTKALTPRLSILGSCLLLAAMFLVGMTIGVGVSWIKFIELLGKFIITILLRANSGLKYAFISVLRAGPLLNRATPVIPTRIEPEQPTRRITELKIAPRIEPELRKTIISAISIPAIPVLNKNTNRTSKLPNVDLLALPQAMDPKKHYSKAALENLSREVEERLLDFGVEVKVVAVCPGPIITRFEMTLAPGLKVSKITGLAKDLARSLSVTSVRVVEVIPGKAVVGLEIPNKHRETVTLREVLESPQYQDKKGPLNIALGKDISGIPIVVNLGNMPHLLVAGTTGSGKSVGVNVMLLSLLFKASPADLRLILIDPKMLELSIYDGIAHLLTPVVTDMNDAANALRWCVAEMERRYQLMAAVGVRNLAGFNTKVMQGKQDGKPLTDPLWTKEMGGSAQALEKLPYVVVIIDEFADMMMVVGKKVEELIARIAQKARAAGIHMILATQRPSVDVITGLIKANVPTRIAFQVSSRIDSRTILDQQGAEQLIGHGDMLYLAPGTGIPIRVHGAYVSDEEVHAVVKAIKQAAPAPEYIDEIALSAGIPVLGIDPVSDMGEQDPLYDEAVAIVTETRKASISYLQRRLKIGYNRSARLIEAMEAAGVVSEMSQNGAREVLAFDVPRK